MQPDYPNSPFVDNSDRPYNVQAAKKPNGLNNISRFKEHLSTILILLAAPLLAILLSLFVFRTYQVDGPSMERTLQNNDRLIIYKLPRTIASITRKDYIPSRYEIIVFNERTSLYANGETKQLIKRVIGLPGERIVVKNGEVKIFNKDNPDGFSVDKAGPEAAVIDTTSGNIDLTIPKGEIFVMGDNRPDSLDSRSFGAIDASQIVGRLSFRLYPLDKWETY